MPIVISVAVGVVAFLTAHVIVWRAFPSDAPRIGLLAALSAGGIALSAAVQVLQRDLALIELYAVFSVDVLLAVLYLFIYAGISRSVSVTLIARLHAHRDAGLDFRTLLEEYAASSRFEDRLRLMATSGLLRLEGESALLTRRGTRLARCAKVLARALGTELSG